MAIVGLPRCLESVEWNGGNECLNGMVEWNSDLKIKYSYISYVIYSI